MLELPTCERESWLGIVEIRGDGAAMFEMLQDYLPRPHSS